MGVGYDNFVAVLKKFCPESKHDEVKRLLSNITFEYRRIDDINPTPLPVSKKHEKLIHLFEKRHNMKFERDPNRDILVFNSMNRIVVYYDGAIDVTIKGVKFTLEESLEIFTEDFVEKLDNMDDDITRIIELTIKHKARHKRNILKNTKL